jgi:hypothetical protein
MKIIENVAFASKKINSTIKLQDCLVHIFSTHAVSLIGYLIILALVLYVLIKCKIYIFLCVHIVHCVMKNIYVFKLICQLSILI